jgi:alkylation response protein AidB-like acyl-CoA dehydrogenase
MTEIDTRSRESFVLAPVSAERPPPGPNLELLARAQSLFGLLRKSAVVADERRLIPRENMEAVKDAGLMRCWAPKRYGGFQANLQTQLGIVAELSKACASTGWTASNMIACSWCVSMFGEETQDEVFGATPDAMICGVLTPGGSAKAVPGGYVIGGTWGVASGCHFADWAEVTVPLPGAEDRPANVGFVLVPMKELTIEDTWFTMGMRGTASNSLIGEDIFVPERRILRLLDASGAMNPMKVSASANEPPYSLSFGSQAALVQLGCPIGLARAALDVALEQIPKRAIAYTRYTVQAEAVATQIALAEAATKIEASIALVVRAAQQADDAAERGVVLDDRTLARIRMDAAWAARNMREAVDSLLVLCGSSSSASRNFLQQIFRDMSTVTLHGLVQPSIMAENYGRALLGLPPDVTFV